MKSSSHPAVRPVAAGTIAVLLAAFTVAQAAPAVRADELTVSGVVLPVPATDVSESDTNLANTAREVVMITDGADGPELTKLRARTDAEAKTLAQKLDAMPGVTAALNARISLPEEPSGADPDRVSADDPVPAAASTTAKAAAIEDEEFGRFQWGLYAVGAESAWKITSGKGVTVAVLDTGVDRTHPDLAGRTLPQVDLVADGLTGDPAGHGTHVAGVIGANLNGIGVVGLANQATILPVRVLDADGVGDLFTVASGISTAVSSGAKVINLSLGTTYNEPVLAQAVANAINRGATVVAAVGNDGAGRNLTEYPAAYPGVLGVTSIDPDGIHSTFANTGSYVDLTAPGELIASTYPEDEYYYDSGTSMAAPFVAASAALVRAANPTLSASAVSGVLQTTAMDDARRDGWDKVFGFGLVQADAAALKAATSPGGSRYTPPKPVSVRVAKAGYGNVLSVDVNPNRGSASYAFRVQKRNANGTWTTLPTVYRTDGAAETKQITLGKGVYRVFVPASTGYAAATSAAVTLTAPTAKVAAGRDSTKGKLVVNVDPNKGSGYWAFKVQKRNANGTWSTLKTTYKTQGSGETRTVNLKKGTYRVVVASKYGYLGATSAPVVLVK